jgi:hypothetical protein
VKLLATAMPNSGLGTVSGISGGSLEANSISCDASHELT